MDVYTVPRRQIIVHGGLRSGLRLRIHFVYTTPPNMRELGTRQTDGGGGGGNGVIV